MHPASLKKLSIDVVRFMFFAACATHAGAAHAIELVDLEPSGPIARDIDELFWTTVALMSLVLIPVFAMTFWFTWKFRASNAKAPYAPDWDRSTSLEWLVWLAPGLIITILAGMTWIYSHRLSPYRPMEGTMPPLEIQVVALDWKWLFIYPEQNVASVNELYVPINRPLSFKITSATVMNSFFIPRLGGQIYAMAGMETELHLIADQSGRYFGENTQFSGRGFPHQNFVAIASSESDFNAWLARARESHQKLDQQAFDSLSQASVEHPITYYATVAPGLFQHVIATFRTAQNKEIPTFPHLGGAIPDAR